jgi:thymidylate kinase
MRAKLYRRLTINKQNKVLRSGGLVIAFIGGDGVGKSTLTTTCQKWLRSLFPTRLVHAGKPPSSIFTAPFNLILLLARKIKPQKPASRREENPDEQDQEVKVVQKISLYSLLYAFRSVTLAWDRQRLLTKSRRRAAHGEIIICDRYPSLQVGAMDSPRLAEIATATGLIGSLYNKLTRTEMSLYQKIPPPDIVLRLNVSVETAKKRNLLREKSFKEEDDYLESRHELVNLWSSPASQRLYDIDTDQSLEDTILAVKKAVWESL